jgi:two-component system KDP operon response regulator KdpE
MAKILIVDDEPLTVEMLATFLKIMGHETIEALNAREAWDQLAIHSPDVMLLDLMLPDQHGLDVCRELRTKMEYQTLPVIIVSAMAPPLIAEARAAGATEYLAKPVQLGNLKATLAKAGIS